MYLNQILICQIPERGKICDVNLFSRTLSHCKRTSEHFQNLVHGLARKLELVLVPFLELSKKSSPENGTTRRKRKVADEQGFVFDQHTILAQFGRILENFEPRDQVGADFWRHSMNFWKNKIKMSKYDEYKYLKHKKSNNQILSRQLYKNQIIYLKIPWTKSNTISKLLYWKTKTNEKLVLTKLAIR